MSSKTGLNVDIIWTENGLLITATGEQVIRSVYTYCLYTHTVHFHFKLECVIFFRLWDLDGDDNYVLPLDETLGFEKGEMMNCVSYCAGKGNCKIYFP